MFPFCLFACLSGRLSKNYTQSIFAVEKWHMGRVKTTRWFDHLNKFGCCLPYRVVVSRRYKRLELTPRNTFPHTCAEFGHLYGSNRIGAGKEVPKIWMRLGPQPLGVRRGWLHTNTPIPTPHMCYHFEFDRCIGQPVQVYIWDERSAGKCAPRFPPITITAGYWNRHGSIGYLQVYIGDP